MDDPAARIASPRRGVVASPMFATRDKRGATVTTKDAFPENEWIRIRRAPFVAGMAISLADPGGPFEMGRETMRPSGPPPTRQAVSSS